VGSGAGASGAATQVRVEVALSSPAVAVTVAVSGVEEVMVTAACPFPSVLTVCISVRPESKTVVKVTGKADIGTPFWSSTVAVMSWDVGLCSCSVANPGDRVRVVTFGANHVTVTGEDTAPPEAAVMVAVPARFSLRGVVATPEESVGTVVSVVTVLVPSWNSVVNLTGVSGMTSPY
jgi:hypothetical protein